jgi:hypothetical protein
MSDEDLSRAWSLLEPTASRQLRIDRTVMRWLDAREASLVAEWLSFIKLDPVAGLSCVAASALAFVLLTPIGWIAASVLL